jgi:magnesium transporter
MSTDFVALRQDVKVRDAIQIIRSLVRKRNPASYAYVVDDNNHLVGVINMRQLIVESQDEQLSAFMIRDVFAVNAFMDIEDVASEVSHRKFFAVPVLDHEKKLLGLIKADQLIGQVQQEATEDLLRMFGAGGTERTFSPITFSLRKRLPWLHVNLATAFLAAAVVAIFESTIAQITALAVFLPVVAGQGGNAGAQSLAIVMRGLVMREIPAEKFWPLVSKEAFIGLVNGILIGIVTAVIAYFWYGKIMLGVVIALAMVVNLFAAGLSGAAIPLIMKSLGLDPAQSSSIVLTTVTDVVGFFSFLGFATLFAAQLM